LQIGDIIPTDASERVDEFNQTTHGLALLFLASGGIEITHQIVDPLVVERELI
jgi:hypothetical protein